MQLSEGCLRRRRRHPVVEGVLEADGMGDHLLSLLRDEEGDELLGGRLVLGGFENGGARDVKDVARVARGEVRDLRMDVGGSELSLHPVPVVLVHHSEGDCAAVDLVGDRLVVRVDVTAGVGLDAVEPRQGGGLAVGAVDRGDDRLEVRLTRGDSQLAFVLGVGQSQDRGRQLGLGDQARVVDEHAHPGRDPDPVALGRVVRARRLGQRRGS